MEFFQYLFDVALVLHDVIGVNQDVVQVDYYAHIQEIREYIVHEALEDDWSIGQSEWYY